MYPNSNAPLSRLVALLLPLLALNSSSPVAADDAPEHRVLLLGDSITKGVRPGVTQAQTFGGQLESTLKARGRNVAIVNVGIGGERTDQALARIDEVLKTNHPNVVTVMYGTNDSYIDPGKTASRLSVEQYTDNLKKLVERIEKAGAKPILMTPPRWADDAKPNGAGENPNLRLEPYVVAVRELARKRELPLVDHYAAWSAAREQGASLRTWTTDGCHPNQAGHQVIADQIYRDQTALLTGRKTTEKSR